MSTIHEMLVANKLIKSTKKPVMSPKQRMNTKTGRRQVFRNGSVSISEDERQQMIADNAYYRAERRNFEPGYELIDWLAAEADIDRRFSKEVLN